MTSGNGLWWPVGISLFYQVWKSLARIYNILRVNEGPYKRTHTIHSARIKLCLITCLILCLIHLTFPYLPIYHFKHRGRLLRFTVAVKFTCLTLPLLYGFLCMLGITINLLLRLRVLQGSLHLFSRLRVLLRSLHLLLRPLWIFQTFTLLRDHPRLLLQLAETIKSRIYSRCWLYLFWYSHHCLH